MQKKTDYNKTSDSLIFSVTGQSGKPRNFLEKILSARYLNTAADYDINAFVGDTDKSMLNALKTPVLATSSSSGYKSIDLKGNRFIQLDSTKRSLRTSSKGQWGWFFRSAVYMEWECICLSSGVSMEFF